MKIIVVAVRDRQLAQFGRPWYAVTRGQAVRSFADEINRAAADNQLYMHPEDYELFALGFFDEEKGVFENLDHPESLSVGSNVKK